MTKLNKFYRNGNLVFEARDKQKAFEVIDQNPGFLVCCYEAETLIDYHLRYKLTAEIELQTEKLVGEFVEDMLEMKVSEIKTDPRYARIKLKNSGLNLY